METIRAGDGRFDRREGVKDVGDLPRSASLPYAMAVDERDRLWLVNGVSDESTRRLRHENRRGSRTPIEKSGARTVRHMIYHSNAGRSGSERTRYDRTSQRSLESDVAISSPCFPRLR